MIKPDFKRWVSIFERAICCRDGKYPDQGDEAITPRTSNIWLKQEGDVWETVGVLYMEAR